MSEFQEADLADFVTIDDALEVYWENYGIEGYRNDNGNGKFLQYIIDQELNDEELPISKELGDDSDPNDCAYSWMNNDADEPFPMPPYVNVEDEKDKEEFIFYLLQYCYKHQQPPSDEYIKQTILPKCGLSCSYVKYVTLHSNKSITTACYKYLVTEQKEEETEVAAPIAFDHSAMIITGSDITSNNGRSYCQLSESVHDQDLEGHPDIDIKEDDLSKDEQVERVSVKNFDAKYPSRAHLNIYTPREATRKLLECVEESFENDLVMYYYTDISTALQINDGEMKEFILVYTSNSGQRRVKLSIVNYDLHLKGEVNDESYLYGIIVPNDEQFQGKDDENKWLWKLDDFLTAAQIEKKYGIQSHELPQSSRKKISFLQQLQQKLVIEESMIDNTDWVNIRQIKSVKRGVKAPKITVTLTRDMFIKECKKSFENVALPLIPVVVNRNNKHWIEWIKIVHIQSQGIYIGVSCKYVDNDGIPSWSVQSICLDRGDIINKHRLVGLNRDRYTVQLSNFNTSITEIKFSDTQDTNSNAKLNMYKQQIRSQQESIVRLKEALLRTKNIHKFRNNDDTKDDEKNEEHDPSHYVRQLDDTEDMIISDEYGIDSSEAWLSDIVNDVIKTYDVLDFQTSPIGAKRNIYIDKKFTKQWMRCVSPRFTDEAQFYYWLDYTTAMQMCQRYSKQYIRKDSRKFIIAVINYELRDINNNVLYGIITFDEDKIGKKNDKYPYKLKTLMTKEQIKSLYGINSTDLPLKSRQHQEFRNKLVLKRRLNKHDLNRINWGNLKLFKSQSSSNTINGGSINKSITMTQKVMKEYTQIALERLNNTFCNKRLIPIMVIDKQNSYYGIEWVLIVNIVHRSCDVGISFKYDIDTNLFIATAIYLDRGEIESKHKLIGLKFDYCKTLRPFSIRKLKFKSGRYDIIDGDDDCAQNEEINQLRGDVLEYKRKYEEMKLKNQEYQRLIQNNEQGWMQEINSLKQQNQLFVNQIVMMQQQQQQQQQMNHNQSNNHFQGYNNQY